MRKKYLKYILLLFISVGCVDEITGPRLEVTIVSPEINPVSAQAIIISGDEVVYEAKALNADTSSYEWLIDGTVVSNTLKTAPINYPIGGQHIARFSASNEDYDSYAQIIVNVVDFASTFEDLTLENNSFWIGEDGSGFFESGSITFPNTPPTEDEDYSNFGYSNINSVINEATTVESTNYENYGAYILTPSNNQFGIARMNLDQEAIRMTFDTLLYPMSISFANNPGVLQHARGDNDITDAFGSGDFYDVEVRGINEDGSLTETFVSLRLLEGSATSFYALEEWTSLDLSPLGQVLGLQYSINTTAKDPDTDILTIEKRFCIDNLILVRDAEAFVN